MRSPVLLVVLLLPATLISGCSQPSGVQQAGGLRAVEEFNLTVDGVHWLGLTGNGTIAFDGGMRSVLMPWGVQEEALAIAVPSHQAWVALSTGSVPVALVGDSDPGSPTYLSPSARWLQDAGMLLALALPLGAPHPGSINWWGIDLTYEWDGDLLLFSTPSKVLVDDAMNDLVLHAASEIQDGCPIPVRFWFSFGEWPNDNPSEAAPDWTSSGTCRVTGSSAIPGPPLAVPLPSGPWRRAPPTGTPTTLPRLDVVLEAAQADPRTEAIFEEPSWFVSQAVASAGGLSGSWTVKVEAEGRTLVFQGTAAANQGIVMSVVSDSPTGTGRSFAAPELPTVSIADMEAICRAATGDSWSEHLEYVDFAGPSALEISGRWDSGLQWFACEPLSAARIDAHTGWLLGT